MDALGLRICKQLTLLREQQKGGMADSVKNPFKFQIVRLWLCAHSHGKMRFQDSNGMAFNWGRFGQDVKRVELVNQYYGEILSSL